MSVEQIARVSVAYFIEKVSRSSISNYPILNELYEAGCIKGIPFGADIRQPTILASNIPDPTDLDGNSMTSQNTNATTSAIYNYKVIPKKIPLSMEQIMQKASKDTARVDWINGEMTSGADSILLATELQLQSDGTYASGLSFDGVRGAVSTTPTIGSFGQIDRSVEPRWRNKAYNGLDSTSSVPDAGNTADLSNILGRLKYIINGLQVGKSGCTHAFCSPDMYELFETAAEDKQRVITNSDTTPIGYQRMTYKGVKIVNTGGLQRVDGNQRLGFPEKTVGFMTLKREKFSFNFFDQTKFNDEFRKMIAYTKDPESMPFNLAAMITPNAENGILMHKSATNSTYYIEPRITGNATYGDLQATAIYFEAPATTPPAKGFTLSSNTSTVAAGSTSTVDIAYTNGATAADITISSSDTGIATVAVSGTTITITGVAAGNANINVSITGDSSSQQTIAATVN